LGKGSTRGGGRRRESYLIPEKKEKKIRGKVRRKDFSGPQIGLQKGGTDATQLGEEKDEESHKPSNDSHLL